MNDERFNRSVIYICAHSSEGAMGIIVNRPAGSIDFPELLVQLDIIEKADQIKLPENAETMKVLKGGPVDTGRGFVLHSADYFVENSTLPIDDGICLTHHLWSSLNAHIFTYLQGVSLQSLVDDAKERKSPSIHVVQDHRKTTAPIDRKSVV